MKILFVASECVPLAKAGGLGDVVGALSDALVGLGHDVRVVIPRYSFISRNSLLLHEHALGVPLGSKEYWCGVFEARVGKNRVPVYLVEHEAAFGGAIYGNDSSAAFEAFRFGLLSKAALQICRYLGFFPDVAHLHDWPSSPIALWLNTSKGLDDFSDTASVLTIHNLSHQTSFPPEALDVLGLPKSEMRIDSLDDSGRVNLFKGGLYHATKLTTVSPGYAEEIKGEPGGAGLSQVLRCRASDLVGILNGIDDEIWNPATDESLPARYSAEDLSGKKKCKAALQAKIGLRVDDSVPVLGIVSRFAHQKGIDFVLTAIERLGSLGVQLAVVGSGLPEFEFAFRLAAKQHDFVGTFVGYNEPMAHLLEAGSDFFVMPSRFEPCGLTQMYSQRYGTPPIVHAVGGLKDTVVPYEPGGTAGDGFHFREASVDAFVEAIRVAVRVYRSSPAIYRMMQRTGMTKQLGWGRSARAYEDVYGWAIQEKRGTLRQVERLDSLGSDAGLGNPIPGPGI